MKRSQLLAELKRRLLPGELSLEPACLKAHAGDKWFAARDPEAVALPRSAKGVVNVLKFAAKHNIPVTPRGAGYGYVGGCVPQRGGIALSLMRLNKIKQISAEDFVAVVEPGVLTAHLQSAVESKGLFYPPDPASRADCSIGGNVATNAGGPRCLKYGVTRDYVLGLEVALIDGSLVRLGSRTHKNKTGFDLHRLFVGSEGMLGVVTEVTLKLLPLPPFRACLSAGFGSMAHAARAIREIFAAGFLPSAVEVADAFTLAAARKRTGTRRFDGCNAHLLVELDGQERSVRIETRMLAKRLKDLDAVFVQRGFGGEACERFWQLRREFSQSLRDTGLTKLNEDIVVPRGKLEELFELAARLQQKHRVSVACFGHAGDGNIHVNVMLDTNDPDARARGEQALDELFQGVLALKGVITGEHGIGLAKMPWWNEALSDNARGLHERIKSALDPKNLLNPGKFLG